MSHDPVEELKRTIISSEEDMRAVDRSKWSASSPQNLSEQLETLERRYYAVLSMGRPDIARQIEMGMDQLREMMISKSKEDPKGGRSITW